MGNAHHRIPTKPKILCVGPVESGKTLFTNWMGIFWNGVTKNEYIFPKKDVLRIILHHTNILIKNADKLGLKFHHKNQDFARCAISLNDALITNEILQQIIDLWKDPTSHQVLDFGYRSTDIDISPSMSYWMSRIENLLDPNYEPSELDTLFSSTQQTSTTLHYDMKHAYPHTSRIEDSMSTKRKKAIIKSGWVGNNVIIYCASLLCFFRHAEASGGTLDHLELFDAIVNTTCWYAPDAKFITLITHGDILQEKLKSMSFSELRRNPVMRGYMGDMTVKSITEYFIDRLVEKHNNKKLVIPYLYFDAYNGKETCKRLLSGNLCVRGVNDPKIVKFGVMFDIFVPNMKFVASFSDITIIVNKIR